MHTIILASSRAGQWREFSDALRADMQADIVNVRSGAEALKAAQRFKPLAVAIDTELDDIAGVELVRQLLGINAMINTALASEKPEEIFHSETEGLGILMQLSSLPTSAEAGRFAECLRRVAGAVEK